MQPKHEESPKTFIVMNPVAGMTEAMDVRQKIESALESHGMPCEIFETKKGADVEAVVLDALARGFELFLAVGGDGTLAAVASGLIGSQARMAIIPTGTWNALARNLNIPLEVDEAIKLIFQEHHVRTIDAMQVNGHYHLLNISAGLGSITMSDVKRSEKRHFGKLPDLWHGLVNLFGAQTYRFEVVIDGKKTQFRASELMVANGPNLGLDAFKIDPKIRLDDGRLNICRIYARNLMDYVNVAISILQGEQKQNWHVLCLEAQDEVEIHCEKKLPLQADGELIGHLPVLVRLRRKAVNVIAPITANS